MECDFERAKGKNIVPGKDTISRGEESKNQLTLWKYCGIHTAPTFDNRIHYINLETEDTCRQIRNSLNSLCWIQFMRTNLNWTAGKETKFKEFSIYLMISRGTSTSMLRNFKYQKQHQRLSVLSYQYLFRFFVCLRSRYTLSKSQKFCQKQPIVGYRTSFDRFPFEGGRMLLNLRRIYFIEWIYISVVFLWIRYGFLCCCCRYALVRTPAHARCLAHCFYLFIFIAGLLRLLLYKVQQSAWTMLSACVSVCVRQSGERQRGQTPPHALKSTFFILR